MSDPYLAGDDEPYYEWRAPKSPDCPNCPCCTTALCETAAEKRGVCGHYANGASVDYDLYECPCSWGNTFAGMRAAAADGDGA